MGCIPYTQKNNYFYGENNGKLSDFGLVFRQTQMEHGM